MKQTQVKMLPCALAPCVWSLFCFVLFCLLSMCLFLLVKPHATCPRFSFWCVTRSNLWMYTIFIFCFMFNVFTVNSGQKCHLHVEFISMSITDFTFSQVGRTWPRSWSRHVLTQLPICYSHYLVCLSAVA